MSEKETVREQLDSGKVSLEDYLIEYGKQQERIRMFDAVMASDLDTSTKTAVRKIIRGEA